MRRNWGAVSSRVFTLTLLLFGSFAVHASVLAVSLQSPYLSPKGTTNLVSPVHFQGTAEGTSTITGYVVYVDNVNVFRNFSPSLDAWVMLPPGSHSVYVKAWDSGSNLSTSTYQINIAGFAPPTPPQRAHREVNIDKSGWTLDNNPDVGGDCNDGSIGTYKNSSDPNTANAPAFDGNGQHFLVTSRCTYDDSLFYRKFNNAVFSAHTNFLWDFWFYIPTTTQNGTLQALEFDLFQAVQLNDGVHEFMFGSQCNYATNQWQIWLPKSGGLTWVDAGISPCQVTAGTWHHATYFLQRVTSSGYQQIPKSFSPSSDVNAYLRFGTLTIDGSTVYLGGLSYSTIPNPAWSPVLGVQYQLDTAASGVTVEEYLDAASLTSW